MIAGNPTDKAPGTMLWGPLLSTPRPCFPGVIPGQWLSVPGSPLQHCRPQRTHDSESWLPKALHAAATAAKLLQLCPTLCNPMDCSLPGFSVCGILQARTLEWVAISFSNAWKWNVKVKLLSRVWLLATPWTAAYQAPPSMGFSRQQYWSVVPLPSPNLILVLTIWW